MNYKHLFYFWKVATSGGVIRAAEQLHTTPQTLSGQIKQLEERLGQDLFRKEGRKLVLTEPGQLALGYADEIFSLGTELEDILASGEISSADTTFRVGIADALPHSISQRLLEPVLTMEKPAHLVCHEWRIDRLLSELAAHKLDLVIADAPIPAGYSVKAYSHRLGASSMAFFAAPALAKKLATTPFPQCLHAQPMLLISSDSAVRAQFELWARAKKIRPRIVAEFDTTSQIKAFGRAGHGFFMAPEVLVDEVCRNYFVEKIGRCTEIEQAYYAISVQRKITHPCAEAIARSAREGLFNLLANK